MSGLSERLGAALEFDALAFSGDDFADARWGSVRTRVRRRRAMRAAGVGGASALGMGALAVGVTHLPFASLGLAGPGSGSVVCTTSAAAPTAHPIDNSKGEDKTWLIYDDVTGGVVLTLTSVGSDLVAVDAAGAKQHVGPNSDGSYTVQVPSGGTAEVVVDGSGWTVDWNAPTTEPSPTVVCATTSPVDTPAPSLSSSATPSSSDHLHAASPFQCGFTFDSAVHDSDGVAVRTMKWLTAGEANAAVSEEYGNTWPTDLVHPLGPVLTVGIGVTAAAPDGVSILDNGGAGDIFDPADYYDRHTLSAKGYLAGTTVVGVTDGRVVATVPELNESPAAMLLWPLAIDNYDLGFTVLDMDAVLVPCGNDTTWTDTYVVTGVGLASGGNWLVDPIYSWAQIPAAD